MHLRYPIMLGILIATTGCSSSLPCEDILEVKQQALQCVQLEKVIAASKNPQQALTARKRFEAECVNHRYYRDDYDTICKGDQQPIGKISKEN